MIVAINTDANAPIFDFAHHGIVGNAMQVLPVLTDRPSATSIWASASARWRLSHHTYRTRGKPTKEKFDAIVVGAGPSGNAAAYTAWPRPG